MLGGDGDIGFRLQLPGGWVGQYQSRRRVARLQVRGWFKPCQKPDWVDAEAGSGRAIAVVYLHYSKHQLMDLGMGTGYGSWVVGLRLGSGSGSWTRQADDQDDQRKEKKKKASGVSFWTGSGWSKRANPREKSNN